MLHRNVSGGFHPKFNRVDVLENNETLLSLIVIIVIELALEFAVCKLFGVGGKRAFLALIIRPNRKSENSTGEVGCVCKISIQIEAEYLNCTHQCLQKAQGGLCNSISFGQEGFSTQLCVVDDWNPKEDIA